jgi:hypothetical protein
MASVEANNDLKQKNGKICGEGAKARSTYNPLHKNKNLEKVRNP